jgi:hypothetical protein
VVRTSGPGGHIEALRKGSAVLVDMPPVGAVYSNDWVWSPAPMLRPRRAAAAAAAAAARVPRPPLAWWPHAGRRGTPVPLVVVPAPPHRASHCEAVPPPVCYGTWDTQPPLRQSTDGSSSSGDSSSSGSDYHTSFDDGTPPRLPAAAREPRAPAGGGGQVTAGAPTFPSTDTSSPTVRNQVITSARRRQKAAQAAALSEVLDDAAARDEQVEERRAAAQRLSFERRAKKAWAKTLTYKLGRNQQPGASWLRQQKRLEAARIRRESDTKAGTEVAGVTVRLSGVSSLRGGYDGDDTEGDERRRYAVYCFAAESRGRQIHAFSERYSSARAKHEV